MERNLHFNGHDHRIIGHGYPKIQNQARMRTILIILRKEFRQIFRNPLILRMILMMPVIQLIVLPLAADYEIKSIQLSVVDQDHSIYSQRLIQKMIAGNYFQLVGVSNDYRQSLETVKNNQADLILTIPPFFEKNLVKEGKTTVHLAANAINSQRGGLAQLYAGQIIGQFNQEIREQWMLMPKNSELPTIEIFSQNRYNPTNNYKLFMVPGILALLVTMVGSLMSALNIVSEKEKGTIEQINVTPIQKYQFIIGKLIPFWVLGLVSLTLGFLASYLVYSIIPLGSYFTIFLYAGVYLFAVLGVGLLLSTFADTQQQATLLAFFIMMMFVLMGGLYTPIESMPEWAQKVSSFLPPSYFIKVIRAVVLKGSGLSDLKHEFLITFIMGLIINTLAILNYRKRAA
jgi:ABC-2 type transport system permease protein